MVLNQQPKRHVCSQDLFILLAGWSGHKKRYFAEQIAGCPWKQIVWCPCKGIDKKCFSFLLKYREYIFLYSDSFCILFLWYFCFKSIFNLLSWLLSPLLTFVLLCCVSSSLMCSFHRKIMRLIFSDDLHLVYKL